MFYFFLFLSLSSSRIMSKGFISPLFLPLLIREEAASHQQRQAQQNSISNNSTRTGLNVTRCTQQHTHTDGRTRKHVFVECLHDFARSDASLLLLLLRKGHNLTKGYKGVCVPCLSRLFHGRARMSCAARCTICNYFASGRVIILRFPRLLPPPKVQTPPAPSARAVKSCTITCTWRPPLLPSSVCTYYNMHTLHPSIHFPPKPLGPGACLPLYHASISSLSSVDRAEAVTPNNTNHNTNDHCVDVARMNGPYAAEGVCMMCVCTFVDTGLIYICCSPQLYPPLSSKGHDAIEIYRLRSLVRQHIERMNAQRSRFLVVV